METSLFMITGLGAAEDGRFKVIEATSYTERGRQVVVEIRVDLRPTLQLVQGDLTWALSGLIFRSRGKESDGILSLFKQLSPHKEAGEGKGKGKGKGKKASRSKMKPEVHFAARPLAGDPAKIGEEKVDLALRFEAAPRFVCRLVINKSTDVFLVIDDDSDEAAIAAFSA
jgi:hypothetical protein